MYLSTEIAQETTWSVKIATWMHVVSIAYLAKKPKCKRHQFLLLSFPHFLFYFGVYGNLDLVRKLMSQVY